ncbi:hypothetical protein [Pseudomonas asiatica]|uniref:hypothetical protein n=1 Tax=Pseudomonas asiatica TaxID=2219225 RepID=UPI003877A41A
MNKAINFEARVIASLANHERLLQQNATMKKQVSKHLNDCPIQKRALDWDTPECERYELQDGKGRIKTHLWQAFNRQVAGAWGPILMDPDEQENYLTDPWNDESRCEHCHAAWKLIQARKEVRQELGKAKRSIRMLGKSALKIADADTKASEPPCAARECQRPRVDGTMFCGEHQSVKGRWPQRAVTNEQLAYMMQRDGYQQ